MTRLKGLTMALAAGALLMVVGSRISPAQDVAQVNAKNVHVKLENAHVRVLDAVLGVGEREPMHSHPAYVTYVISGGKIRTHLPDGTTSETELKDGQTIYRDGITHWAENIGTTPLHFLLVELKTPN